MRQPLRERVARIVQAHSVDIVLFAESTEQPDDVCHALRADFSYPDTLDAKTRLYLRWSIGTVFDQFIDPTGSLSIRRLRILSVAEEVLLAMVHFPSRVNYDREDQTLEVTTLMQDVCRVEDDLFTTRTILVGDFNMNPFDTGMTGAQALHAVMTKQLAGRGERKVRGRSYRFFYNPMWGYFGDRTNGPPGTYYLASSKPDNLFWNMYDQVLLRPALMTCLQELQILDSDGMKSLLTKNGLPDGDRASDHLPLLFTLDL